MALRQFSLNTLADLDDGRAIAMFDQHLKRAALDCMDRADDKKPRKITLEVHLIPVLEPDRTCIEVKARIHAKSTVPPNHTKEYSIGTRPNGMLVFNPDSDNDVNQSTLLPEE